MYLALSRSFVRLSPACLGALHYSVMFQTGTRWWDHCHQCTSLSVLPVKEKTVLSPSLNYLDYNSVTFLFYTVLQFIIKQNQPLMWDFMFTSFLTFSNFFLCLFSHLLLLVCFVLLYRNVLFNLQRNNSKLHSTYFYFLKYVPYPSRGGIWWVVANGFLGTRFNI